MAKNPCGLSSRSSFRTMRPGALAIVVAGGLLGLSPRHDSAAEIKVVREPARQPVEARRPAPRADRAPRPAVAAPAQVAPAVRRRVVAQQGVIVTFDHPQPQQPSGPLNLFPPEPNSDADDQRGDDSSIARLLSIPKRAWGPEQAVGEPDTPGPGDIQTAWASQTPDGETEWLQVEYAQPVTATHLLVHETCSPGALFKVSVFDPDGKEVTVWQGADPTPVGTGWGVSEIPIDVKFKVQRAKIYLDSTLVAGFNEIDAVGLNDDAGKTHWARSAKASSTYAPSVVTLPVTISASDLVRLRALDQEVKQLRKEIKKIHELEAALQELRKLIREQAATKTTP